MLDVGHGVLVHEAAPAPPVLLEGGEAWRIVQKGGSNPDRLEADSTVVLGVCHEHQTRPDSSVDTNTVSSSPICA